MSQTPIVGYCYAVWPPDVTKVYGDLGERLPMGKVLTVGAAVATEFLRQKIAPWGGIDIGTVVPPVDWDAVGRAAIEAMREPTEAMQSVIPPLTKWDNTTAPPTLMCGFAFGQTVVDVYHDMIDAALKEPA